MWGKKLWKINVSSEVLDKGRTLNTSKTVAPKHDCMFAAAASDQYEPFTIGKNELQYLIVSFSMFISKLLHCLSWDASPHAITSSTTLGQVPGIKTANLVPWRFWAVWLTLFAFSLLSFAASVSFCQDTPFSETPKSKGLKAHLP